MAELPVKRQSYKPFPSYGLPREIGSFSHDEQGKVCMDRSQLQYYAPPAIPRPPQALHLDLGVGYDDFVPKPQWKAKPEALQGITPILRWMATQDVDNEDLDSVFVTWRGMLTKILCCPYNKRDCWAMAVTLFNGSIYLNEIETEEWREREASRSEFEKRCGYWGYKFEDYVSSSAPPHGAHHEGLARSGPSIPRAVDKPGTVNTIRAFCSVAHTCLNSHSVVLAGEVDCCDHTSHEQPPWNYIEFKTSMAPRNVKSFKWKCLKWWAQSYLIGVPRIVCGFRDNEGIVDKLQEYKTTDIPKQTEGDRSLWQPSVCLNFLDEALTWIKRCVVKDNPKVVYLVEWKRPFSCLTCRECPPNSELQFLPDWYIHKQPPPKQ